MARQTLSGVVFGFKGSTYVFLGIAVGVYLTATGYEHHILWERR